MENAGHTYSSSHFSWNTSSTRNQCSNLSRQRLFSTQVNGEHFERNSRQFNSEPKTPTSTILRHDELFSNEKDEVTGDDRRNQFYVLERNRYETHKHHLQWFWQYLWSNLLWRWYSWPGEDLIQQSMINTLKIMAARQPRWRDLNLASTGCKSQVPISNV